MMSGTSWLLALVVATARGVAGITDGAGCGATCGERAPTPPPFPRKPRDAAAAPPRRASVAVVGGGPGGALAALLLARQERLDVTLYEKELDVGTFERRSYSISIRDKGVAALREAGGAAAPERIGEVRSGLAIHYPVGDDWETREIPAGKSDSFGTDRPRLCAGILAQIRAEGRCTIRRGSDVEKITVVEGLTFKGDLWVKGDVVQITALETFAGRQMVVGADADAVVGADGKWSGIRQTVLEADWPVREEPRFGITLRLKNMPEGFAADKTHLVHGKTLGMALYAIVAPLVEGASCSIVLHEAALEKYPGLGPAETGTGWEAGRVDQAWAEAVADAVVEELSPEIVTELGGWPGAVRAAREGNRGMRSSWVEAPEDVSYAFEGGRVALVGDAAHSVTPALGLGANLALESAVKLSEAVAAALATEDDAVAAVHAGFRAYGASRPLETVPMQLASAKASRELNGMKAPRGPVRE